MNGVTSIFWILLISICVQLACCEAALAGNAAFSADGKVVYTINWDSPGTLNRVEMNSQKAVTIKVKLGKDDVVDGIARAKDGAFYLVTKNTLWRWQAGEDNATLLEPSPTHPLNDVACNPQTDEILLTSGSDLYYKRNSRTAMIQVNIRYQPGNEICSPVYLQDGSFLFGADGDLWHGIIDYYIEDPETKDRLEHADLTAYRYAPLATRETYNGSPVETGVGNIAVSNEKVYVDFRRMGGSGWGSILRLNLPVQKKGIWTSNNTAKDTVQTLSSVEELFITGGNYIFIFGAPDGKQVYYYEKSDNPCDYSLLSDEDKGNESSSDKIMRKR